MATAAQVTAVENAVQVLVSSCSTTLLVAGASAEVSMYGHFQAFLDTALATLAPTAAAWTVTPQTHAPDGIPDYRVEQAAALRGWVEIKAVDGTKDLRGLTGHDKRQKDRFVAGLHNVIYSNGWQWELFQDGNQVGPTVELGATDTFTATTLYHPSTTDIERLCLLIESFVAARPGGFASPEDAVRALATRAKALKLALEDVDRSGAGANLQSMEQDFKDLLYRHGGRFTWKKFVDAYVQIAVFGLLLWRLESGTHVSMSHVVSLKPGLHPLLAQTLSILWNPAGRPVDLEPLLEELCNTVNAIPLALFAPRSSGHMSYVPDPIVHAYEPFFAAYDRASRDEKGVFYTPFPIVRQIISGVDHLLSAALGKPRGILDDDALYLDPATGTGTFLLGLAEAVAAKAAHVGVAPDTAVEEVLTRRTSAFELFPGPYTIAHQRVEATLASHGVTPTGRLPIFLADTLAAPDSASSLPASAFGPLGAEIVKERKAVDSIKQSEKILVVLGNPPYERMAVGGSVEPFARRLAEILRQATPAAERRNLKSTADLYVLFWLWSIWILQSPTSRVPTDPPAIDSTDSNGIIAFISNRTWIVGGSLSGLRSLLYPGANEIWVLDLGGDNRGNHGARSFAGGDANVFNIQTGVAIAWVVFDRENPPPVGGAPIVHYRRMYGTRGAKLTALQNPFDPADYATVPLSGGSDPYIPVHWNTPALQAAPTIAEWFKEAAQTGTQTARDKSAFSPIGIEPEDVYATVSAGRGTVLKFGSLAKWAKLNGKTRKKRWATAQERRSKTPPPMPATLDPARVRRYWYRPLDHRSLYDDSTWITWDRPDLRRAFPSVDTDNWALVTLPHGHGRGPAVIHAGGLPDQHYFRGSAGGRAVFPLWWPASGPADARRDRGRRRVGFSDLILDWLDRLGRGGQFIEAYDYALAVTHAPTYTAANWQALESDAVRIPLTDDPAKFDQGAALGAKIRQAWSRSTAPMNPVPTWSLSSGATGNAPYGNATYVSGEIHFSGGRKISGVPDAVWRYEISGYAVLPEYLRARAHWTDTMKRAIDVIATISSVAALVDLEHTADTFLASL